MSTAPEDMLRTFEAAITEQVDRARTLSERLRQGTATVESPGGEVRVVVDSTGGLSGLRFSDDAGRLPLTDLAELILATSQRAQAELAATMSELAAAVYGPGSATAGFVTEAYTEQFPTPESAPPDNRRPDPNGGRR